MKSLSLLLLGSVSLLGGCGSPSSQGSSYSVSGTYVAASGDGIVNIQFTDATHYSMLRDVCATADACSEQGTYVLAANGTSIAFSPTDAPTYTFALEATAQTDVDAGAAPDAGTPATGGVSLGATGLQVLGTSLGGGAGALASGGQDSLTSGTSVSLVGEDVAILSFSMNGQSFQAANAKNILFGFGPDDSSLTMGEPTPNETVSATEASDLEAFQSGDPHSTKICHQYLSWSIAGTESGDKSAAASFTSWLQAAQKAGVCNDLLVTFQAQNSSSGDRTQPTATQYENAMEDFLKYPWGWKGTFSFTAWNEPNNRPPGGVPNAGNGTHAQIGADLAAEYYLILREKAGAKGYEVAAGDFESNTPGINDYQQHCANHETATPCTGATYLDKYETYIYNHAASHGLPGGKNFRPEHWALHGWFDINDYLLNGIHASGPADSAVDAMLRGTAGGWAKSDIWDTEVGIGQTSTVSDDLQACAAAFLLRLHAQSTRVTRIYYQNIGDNDWQIVHGATHRPAFAVLSNRALSYTPTTGVCP